MLYILSVGHPVPFFSVYYTFLLHVLLSSTSLSLRSTVSSSFSSFIIFVVCSFSSVALHARIAVVCSSRLNLPLCPCICFSFQYAQLTIVLLPFRLSTSRNP
eukprot:m.271408 g.271408  ORF g.271408 m.271408 type:complete len:102 (+) comp85643_c0_seq1:168-473(+)